jgi:uncharacterized coiled-coil DUF342 family protein
MAGDDRTDSVQQSALSAAYAERTKQLHDARGAIAEAVSTLRAELGHRREELAAVRQEAATLRDERDRAVTDNRALRQEVEAQRRRIAELEEGLEQTTELVAVLQNMKVVRWSGPLRRFVYRLRARRR